jgi:hypothetical protein
MNNSMKIEEASSDLRDAEDAYTAAQERVRALWERAGQVNEEIAERTEQLEAADSLREDILRDMLFDDTARSRLDQHNDERNRNQREIADLTDLFRKATAAAETESRNANDLSVLARNSDRRFKALIFEERCSSVVHALQDELEELAFTALDLAKGFGVDPVPLARERAMDALLPRALFCVDDERRLALTARIRDMAGDATLSRDPE